MSHIFRYLPNKMKYETFNNKSLRKKKEKKIVQKIELSEDKLKWRKSLFW